MEREPRPILEFARKAAIVIGGILVSPLALLLMIVPRKLYKSIFLLLVIFLVYKFVYPRESLALGTHRLSNAFAHGVSKAVDAGRPLWNWLDNETNATFLASIVALATLVITAFTRRTDMKRERDQEIAKVTPKMTVGFAPTSDGKFVCTLLNIGGGTALSVKFSFLVLANPGSHSYSEDTWLEQNSRSYHYVLPEAKDPKAIEIEPIDVSRSPELMVRCEYIDSLDRNHYAFAYGGQSRDGTFMSVGTWHTITTAKGQRRSLWARAGAYLFLQSERGFAMIKDAVRRYGPSEADVNKDWRKGRQEVVPSRSDVSSGGPEVDK